MMRLASFALLPALWLPALTAAAGDAPSLSIYRDRTLTTWLKAISELDTAYRFQSSSDFVNWADISDAASGAFAHRLQTQGGTNRFFRLRTWPTQDVPVTLAIVGDSTAADFITDDSRFAGWGQGLYDRMKPNVRVVNFAVPNQSSLSFLYSVQKENLSLVKPDFVLIQFGLVDNSTVEGFHTSIPEYETNLTAIVQTVREFQGTPILVTPTGVRYFDDEGKIIPVLQDRRDAVRRVADETQTFFVDLNLLTTDLYNKLGPDKVDEEIESHPGDGAHYSLTGAGVIAGLLIDGFPDILRAQVLSP